MSKPAKKLTADQRRWQEYIEELDFAKKFNYSRWTQTYAPKHLFTANGLEAALELAQRYAKMGRRG